MVGDSEHRQRQPADNVEMGLDQYQNEILTYHGRDDENHTYDDGDVDEPFVGFTYNSTSLEWL